MCARRSLVGVIGCRVWSFPGWQRFSTQLTLHPPTCTNHPAINRHSVKQKDSKNKRMNFLPQTTIRLVSGSQTGRATAEQRKRWKSAISRNPQLLPLFIRCLANPPPPTRLNPEGGAVLHMLSVWSTRWSVISNWWHGAVLLFSITCHSACLGVKRAREDGWSVKVKGRRVRAGQCQALLEWVDRYDGQLWMVPLDFQEAWHLDLLHRTWNWAEQKKLPLKKVMQLKPQNDYRDLETWLLAETWMKTLTPLKMWSMRLPAAASYLSFAHRLETASFRLSY